MSLWLWAGFITFITLILVLDLAVLNRKPRAIGVYEALAWTTFWVSLALTFNVCVYFIYEYHWLGMGLDPGNELDGAQAALQFFTGYLIEKSLSIDNIFVIALIFAYFHVPLQFQHRVLFWGIFGAIVLRCIMIVFGLALINAFSWIIYVFGVFLIFTAIKMLIQRHDNITPDKNPLVKFVKRHYPVSDHYDGDKFFTRLNGQRAVTPLLLALLLIETADVIFAIDSIPAIISITRDPFLIFTSNIFAILGLRTLYFALAGLMNKLRYLKISLVFLLAFIGVKMLLAHHYPISTTVSLAVITGILTVGVLASVFGARRDTAALASPLADDVEMLVVLSVKGARRIVILVTGITVLVVGIIMIVLPGPAIIVIPLGLAILATEFVWAKRWLDRFKTEATNLTSSARNLLWGKKDNKSD
ncbi:MAG TPA: TerC/Alx family metal homeostasis membrane protein [Gammaproteobacteria bacterium]